MSTPTGPDLLIVGAARSGTTNLAARLSRHPDVVAPSTKEPNFFSLFYDRGFGWYESLYEPLSGGRVRIDSSVTYGYPRFAAALTRVHEVSPHAKYVYVVRQPVERTYSQYCQEVLYLQGYGGSLTFGEAVDQHEDFASASDYALVLENLRVTVPRDHLLVIPFEVVVDCLDGKLEQRLWRWVGLDPVPPEQLAAETTTLYTNERTVISNRMLRHAFNWVRRRRLWPRVRSAIGHDRMRRIRRRITSSDSIPTLEEALETCDPAVRERLDQQLVTAREAVAATLREQDERLGTDWQERCSWLTGSLPVDVQAPR